jgi:hypothetical protein
MARKTTSAPTCPLCKSKLVITPAGNLRNRVTCAADDCSYATFTWNRESLGILEGRKTEQDKAVDEAAKQESMRPHEHGERSRSGNSESVSGA